VQVGSHRPYHHPPHTTLDWPAAQQLVLLVAVVAGSRALLQGGPRTLGGMPAGLCGTTAGAAVVVMWGEVMAKAIDSSGSMCVHHMLLFCCCCEG
jgi:hypothetical protein